MRYFDDREPGTATQQQLGQVLGRLSGTGAPRVVAIVVTWNSSDHIDQCLDSIRRSNLARCHLGH